MAIKNPFSSDHRRPADRYPHWFTLFLVGLALLAAGIALLATVVEVWPVVDRADEIKASDKVDVTLFFFVDAGSFALNEGLFVLVIVAGALGAYIHAATSFGSFVGNRDFKSSWLWWYALRLPIGGALALLLYFVFRGGLLPGYDATEEINPYGVAALAAFAGLFSKQATYKLKEIFDVMFKTPPDQGDDALQDSLAGRRPEIASFEPAELAVGATALTVLGERFEQDAMVLVAGDPRTTTWVSEKKLTVVLTAADTEAAGALELTVRNPPPGEPTSDAKEIDVV